MIRILSAEYHTYSKLSINGPYSALFAEEVTHSGRLIARSFFLFTTPRVFSYPKDTAKP